MCDDATMKLVLHCTISAVFYMCHRSLLFVTTDRVLMLYSKDVKFYKGYPLMTDVKNKNVILACAQYNIIINGIMVKWRKHHLEGREDDFAAV